MPHKGYKQTEEHRLKIKSYQIGRLPSLETRIKMSLSKQAEKSHAWKGQGASYSAFHHWMKDNFGKAIKCENINCKGKSSKFHWALKKGCVYDHIRENFIQLCVSCHVKYDMTPERKEKISKRQTGRKLTQKWKDAISKANKGRVLGKGYLIRRRKVEQRDLQGNLIKIWDSMTEAAKTLKINLSGIIMNCRGTLKKSKGYKWNYLDNSIVKQ